MGFPADSRDRAAQLAAMRWLQAQLSWEVRLNELRHVVAADIPVDEVAVRRASPQPARRTGHLSAAS